MAEVTLQVKGMTCGGCKKSVETGVSALNGVENVNVELETGTVQVTYNESQIDVEQIKSTIQSKGYFVVA